MRLNKVRLNRVICACFHMTLFVQKENRRKTCLYEDFIRGFPKFCCINSLRIRNQLKILRLVLGRINFLKNEVSDKILKHKVTRQENRVQQTSFKNVLDCSLWCSCVLSIQQARQSIYLPTYLYHSIHTTSTSINLPTHITQSIQ